MVPLLPLAILFLAPLFVRLPRDFVLEGRAFDTNSVSILAAMLAGVVAAGLAAPRRVGELPKAFLEGAGFAYVHVISLIVTATIFTEGIKANGLIEAMTRGLAGRPLAAQFASIAVPWLLAMATGSGIAPAVAVIKVLVPAAAAMHLDPLDLGGLIAVAAQFGRTMSPVAAVTMMAATISKTAPTDLIRRVAPALLAGLAVLLVAALLGIV